MNSAFFQDLAGKYKNFVFIGEAGSGKTEAAINLSQGFAKIFRESGLDKSVHYFDMDQTKANLRARDVEDVLSANGVALHYSPQLLDAPTVVGGVIEHLKDPKAAVLIDVGGGAYGSHMIAQFSEYLSGPDTAVMYIVNPYRPWSISREEIEDTMNRVLGAGRLNFNCLVCNPNLGPYTTVEEYMEGYRKMLWMFPNETLSFCFAAEPISGEVEKLTGVPTYPIKVTATPEWLYDFS